jgi:hypothetical protein
MIEPAHTSAARFSRVRAPNAGARGAVLIVAMLVAALIAIMLGSYLTLNLATARMSKRTFNGYAALNLGEAGTEEAVWCFNTANRGDNTVWDSWTRAGTTASRKFANFDLGSGNSGWVKVYVNNTTPSVNGRPKVIAQAATGGADDTAVVKMVEVTLRRRTYFANGLVAKKSVVFNGAVSSVDSWNSDPDNNSATASVPYSTAVRSDKGSIASAEILNSAVLLNQASVWGTVSTGGSAPQVGNGGSIRGADTPANVQVDANRISTDFSADFTSLSAPLDGTIIATLPAVLGVVGTTTRWRTSGITLSGNDSLTVLGDVTIILTSSTGTQSISVTGNASINVPDKSSLTIYVEGDVKIAGKGLANGNNQPISCQIWGTNKSPAGQQIDLTGNGGLKTVVYAPNGDVKVSGNGDVMGSLVASSITLAGNAAFHYDESLAERESNAPFTIAKWRELTTEADLSAYASIFTGIR